MSSEPTSSWRSSASLVGDACLLTAASFAVPAMLGGLVIVTGLLKVTPEGPASDPLSMVLALLVNAALPLFFLAGPVAAWMLHGRGIRLAAVLGGIAGLVASALVIGGFFAAMLAAGAAISRLTASQFTLPVIVLMLASLGLLAAALGLDVEAVRDVAHTPVLHERLDIARLVATGVLVLFVIALAAVTVLRPVAGYAEAGIFALVAAAAGGITAGVADLVVSLVDRRGAGRRTVGRV